MMEYRRRTPGAFPGLRRTILDDIPLDEGPSFGYQRNNRLLFSVDFSVRHTTKMNAMSRITNIFTALTLLAVSVVVVVRQGLGAS